MAQWAAGGLIFAFLAWPLFNRGSAEYNREDHWIRTILEATLVTGRTVMASLLTATIFALVVSLLLLPKRPYSLLGRREAAFALAAAVPFIIWIYLAIACIPRAFPSGFEPLLATTVAIAFPLILAFLTALHEEYSGPILAHVRHLEAPQEVQLLYTLRLAGPRLLEAVRLNSLASWSLVLFSETQVALATSQGVGATLGVWSRNGFASLSRLAFGCSVVCITGLVVANGIRSLSDSLLRANDPSVHG